jgi:hypothetical protein
VTQLVLLALAIRNKLNNRYANNQAASFTCRYGSDKRQVRDRQTFSETNPVTKSERKANYLIQAKAYGRLSDDESQLTYDHGQTARPTVVNRMPSKGRAEIKPDARSRLPISVCSGTTKKASSSKELNEAF